MLREHHKFVPNPREFIVKLIKNSIEQNIIVWAEFRKDQEYFKKVFPQALLAIPPNMFDMADAFTTHGGMLITNTRSLGLGFSFPKCTMMIFYGPVPEANYYQAIHRTYRIDQKQSLTVWIVENNS